MKFLRWILSHLTLIILISLLIYLFWNRNEIWPEEVTAREATVKKHSEQPVTKKIVSAEEGELKHVIVDSNDQVIKSQNTTTKKLDYDENNSNLSHSSIEASTNSQSSSDFSERMSQYRESLRVEDRKEMDSAEEIFQQVSDGIIKFPSQNDVEMITDSSEQLLKKSMEVSVDDSATAKMSQYPSEIIQGETIIGSQYEILDELIEQPVVKKPIVKKPIVAQSIEEKQSKSVILDKATHFKLKPQTAKVQTKDAHTQNLQYQIRNRQKQLQKQMVMLVPLSNAKSSNLKDNTTSYTRKKNKSYQFKPIKPVINTPQQRIMLKEARSAFDKKNFIEAEAKYQQVMKELPELPDVVGELANVYRTQNKLSDYLATNTSFVKRLVNHKRYNEAWNVVKMTSSFNEEIAEQQRKIILREQAQ